MSNASEPGPASIRITDYGAREGALATTCIQSAIDACGAAGGGRVQVPAGTFTTGTLRLRDGVVIEVAKGAILLGSTGLADYPAPGYEKSLLYGHGLRRIGLVGEGIIDGQDCRNPKGEEGFRGPHGLLLVDCHDIEVRGVRLQRIGNYALYLQRCSNARFGNVSVRGGHDGLHAQACRGFIVEDCDLRTGDDCVAGCDNHDFRFSRVALNSSCNAFRFGCDGLVVEDARMWGPGESAHQISSRHNMLAAFVHFSPADRKPEFPSDHWRIRRIQLDDVETLYLYDREQGVWQEGMPARDLRFAQVTGRNLHAPLRILGNGARAERDLSLTLEESSLALSPTHAAQPVIEARRFASLILREVELANDSSTPQLIAAEGGDIRLTDVRGPGGAPAVTDLTGMNPGK